VLDPKSRNDRICVGATIAAVYYVEQQPHYASCRVTASRPFELECADEYAANLGPDQRLMLVNECAGGFSRAVATIVSVRRVEGAYRIVTEPPQWELLDKRSYPRHEKRIPVKVRTVVERAGLAELREIGGVTENVGLGGAWIRSDGEVPKGNLVEVRLELGAGNVVRVLGATVRCESPYGFAVQFLDYIGTARHHLHNYLEAA